MNIKLFGICYKPEHFSAIESKYDAWDNLENPTPELCEYPIFNRAYTSVLTKDLDYWGLVSPKFESKSALTGNQFLDWVTVQVQNDPKDVYFLNPVPIVEAIFPGTIQHGENCHPGLLGLLQRHIPYGEKLNLANLYMDCNTFSMCNYFVGNRKFWENYTSFVNGFLKSVESNPADKQMMYATGANYGRDKSIPYFTFVVERLFSIFLNMYGPNITHAHYIYDRDALLKKTQLPEVIVDELRALTDIKQVALSGGHFGMMQHWVFLRNKLTQANQYLFHME